jgi:hypothetical protein
MAKDWEIQNLCPIFHFNKDLFQIKTFLSKIETKKQKKLKEIPVEFFVEQVFKAETCMVVSGSLKSGKVVIG